MVHYTNRLFKLCNAGNHVLYSKGYRGRYSLEQFDSFESFGKV